jgi:hypothetical protein
MQSSVALAQSPSRPRIHVNSSWITAFHALECLVHDDCCIETNGVKFCLSRGVINWTNCDDSRKKKMTIFGTRIGTYMIIEPDINSKVRNVEKKSPLGWPRPKQAKWKRTSADKLWFESSKKCSPALLAKSPPLPYLKQKPGHRMPFYYKNDREAAVTSRSDLENEMPLTDPLPQIYRGLTSPKLTSCRSCSSRDLELFIRLLYRYASNKL